MNTNLIRRLEKQCWDYQSNCVDAEKFAELIVAKCLNNMEDCDGDLDFAIWKTKNKFGVEE